MIRPATPADIPHLARIVSDWERGTGYLPDTPPLPVLEQLLTDALPQRMIWVTGTPAEGYLSLDPVQAKVGALYLSHPGQGIGKRLMDQAKQGRDHLWLTVYEPNTRARAFYLREGFTVTTRLPPEDARPPVLRMDWRRPEQST